MQKETKQGIAPALAAGKHADLFENIVFGEQKTTEQAAQFCLRRARRGVTEVVDHARVRIQFFVLVLREVVGLNVVAESVFSAGSVFRAREQFIRVDLSSPLPP